MEELYKRVLSGDISKLPSQFSVDLYEVVCLLIKVNSNNRPNCADILNNKLIKKRIEYFNSMNNNNENEGENNMDEKEEQSLLKTIHIPKNLLYLSNQLPKPNYNKKKINKSNTACELEINNLNKNIFPMINKAKSTLPNININTKNTNDDTKISSDFNNNLSKGSNNENEINIINNSNINNSNINNSMNNNNSGINNQIGIKKMFNFIKNYML